MTTAIVSTKTFWGKKLVFWSFKDTKSLRENSDMINFIKAKSLKVPASGPQRPCCTLHQTRPKWFEQTVPISSRANRNS